MQVSVPVGIIIIAFIWSLPVGIVYLVHRFMKWQDSRKKLAVVAGMGELEKIIGNSKTIEEVSRDGSRKLTLGYSKEGF